LYFTTNECYIAILKVKSILGDFHNTVLAMRYYAHETSMTLFDFSHNSKDHTTLTSKSSIMFEKVLAITNYLCDVHSLGKKAIHCTVFS
jgi:hypothetical protein